MWLFKVSTALSAIVASLEKEVARRSRDGGLTVTRIAESMYKMICSYSSYLLMLMRGGIALHSQNAQRAG